jgi:RNA polymerase sigma-70 factor (ECF subfamily)
VEMSADSKTPSSRMAQLTRRLAAGDEAAFREFHAEYFDRLYRFLLVATHGHEQEAKEALQQTFLRLVRYIRVFESEDVFWGWLKAVARSAALDGNRKEQRYSALLHRFAFTLPTSGTTCGLHEENRLAALLEESLAELVPDERRLLEAKYLEGYTVKELCLQTGLTEKAIESRLDRLRQMIRNRIFRKLASST